MPDSVDQSNSQYTMIQQQIPGFDLQGQHGGLAGNSYSQYTGVSTMDPNSIATTTGTTFPSLDPPFETRLEMTLCLCVSTVQRRIV